MEKRLEDAKLADWVKGQRRRKWRWAEHVARKEDRRWSTSIVGWTPHQSYGRVGKRNKPWRDDLNAYFGLFGRWVDVAKKQEDCKAFEESFVKA